MQARGVDGQAVELVLVLAQVARQAQLVHIFFGKRIVGGSDTELQRQVQGRRGFPASGDADQDDVGLIVVTGGAPVVIGQGIVHRVDTVGIGLGVGRTVQFADGKRGFTLEFVFQRSDEGGEKVHDHGLAGANDLAQLGADDGVEDDGTAAVAGAGGIDGGNGFGGLLGGVDEGEGPGFELHIAELGEQGIAHHFRGNPRSI